MVEPLKDLYDPEHTKEQAAELVKIINPLLEEEIHRATQLFRQCEKALIDESATAPRDAVMPAFYLFLHIIEIADGLRRDG